MTSLYELSKKKYELSNIKIKKLQLQIELKELKLKKKQTIFEIKKINHGENDAEYESESDDDENEGESLNKILLFEKKIEYEKTKQELIKLQIESNEIQLKNNEIDLKIKKIDENNKNTEPEQVEKKEPELFTIRKRNPSTIIPKVYQYNPDNLTTPINMYNGGPLEIERNNPTIMMSPASLKQASQNNTIYKGFRWLYVNRNEEPPLELEPTKETKHVSPEVQFIAMIDIKKTKILAVYSNQKEAVEARNMKCSGFTRAIQQQSLSSGHYWNFFDKCSQEMIDEYLSHSKLPEKYVPTVSKKVQQIDPRTNEIVKTYNSNTDVCKTAQISTATLRRITKTDEIYNGYKWKHVN